MRLRADDYADRGATSRADQQQAFADVAAAAARRASTSSWSTTRRCSRPALDELRDDPPRRPLVFVTGHTHRPALERIGDTVTVVNGGTVGGGGTGNLAEGQRRRPRPG